MEEESDLKGNFAKLLHGLFLASKGSRVEVKV